MFDVHVCSHCDKCIIRVGHCIYILYMWMKPCNETQITPTRIAQAVNNSRTANLHIAAKGISYYPALSTCWKY